jgi:hypothetical protein
MPIRSNACFAAGTLAAAALVPTPGFALTLKNPVAIDQTIQQQGALECESTGACNLRLTPVSKTTFVQMVSCRLTVDGGNLSTQPIPNDFYFYGYDPSQNQESPILLRMVPQLTQTAGKRYYYQATLTGVYYPLRSTWRPSVRVNFNVKPSEIDLDCGYVAFQP